MGWSTLNSHLEFLILVLFSFAFDEFIYITTSIMSIRMFWIRSTVFCSNKYFLFPYLCPLIYDQRERSRALSLSRSHNHPSVWPLPFNGTKHTVSFHKLTNILYCVKRRRICNKNRLFFTLLNLLLSKQRNHRYKKIDINHNNNNQLSSHAIPWCYHLTPFHLINSKNVELKHFKIPPTKRNKTSIDTHSRAIVKQIYACIKK